MSVIAEIGQNHIGSMNLACNMIELAKQGGADLVKFQLYDHNKLYSEHPEIPNVELSFKDAKNLYTYGKLTGIEVFFSVFDVERVKWCEEIGVKRYKIAAGDFLEKNLVMNDVWATKKPVILSIADNMNCALVIGELSLYCVSKYPAEISDIDWKTLRHHDGFSDHTIGLDAAKIALARGAVIIEKHFAIDHNTGIDAPWSMDSSELKELKHWEQVCHEAI